MKPTLETMTLREKIGQTGMPSPSHVKKGILTHGSYEAYFTQYPFSGLYIDDLIDHNGNHFSAPEAMQQTLRQTSENIKIPLLVTCDAERGGSTVFPQLHRICANMSVGAASDPELTYKRAYYWAREMHLCGVNWVFGPVIDLHKNFFCTNSTRCLSADHKVAQAMIPHILRGIHDAGVASCAKHYPSGGKDYRDAHFCASVNDISLDEWNATNGVLWKAASDAGAMTVMVGHSAVPAMDDSFARPGIPRPASASKKALDILRHQIGFDGLIVTDAVSMKGLAAAFEHEDVYIECLNAGNDIVLFCHNDYIDVIEKAVLDGRVSMQRLDEACQRVLDLKEKLGLFDGISVVAPLTEQENAAFDQVNYNMGKKALTLIKNAGNLLPFAPEKVKKAALIRLAPSEKFDPSMNQLVQAFNDRGVETTVVEHLRSKEQLLELTQENDLIVYVCYLAQSAPIGMSFYSKPEDLNTLFHSYSFGAEKSVAVSFGAPSIFYNYFETADAFINAYSCDQGTIRAFVDGIFGAFPFVGKSPVPLKPEFKDI